MENILTIEEKVNTFKNLKKNYDENIIDIKVTNNYSQFKNILGNRNVKDKNLNKLVKSMKEKQLIIPIVCNEKFEIIDGQHRFTCCKKLKLPVYYYIIPNYTINEVKSANLISCNWSIDDYLNLFVKLGKEEYIKFYELTKHHGLNTRLLLDICSICQNVKIKDLRFNFVNGIFTLENTMQIHNFLNALENFNHFKEYRTTSFVRAFLKLYSYEKYDHEKMKKRLASLYYKLEKRRVISDYIILLVDDIYCYGNCNYKFGYDVKNKQFYSIA